MSPRRSEHAERYLINVNAAGEARAEKKRQLIKLHNLKILKRGFKRELGCFNWSPCDGNKLFEQRRSKGSCSDS